MSQATKPLIYDCFSFQVGDLLMATFNMIPTAITVIRNSHTWISVDLFGQVTCKLLLFAQSCSMACSIFTLTVLAFERFFAVVFPMWKAVPRRTTAGLILAIWVASTAASSPLLYAAKAHLFDGTPYCYENWAPAFDHRRASSIFTAVSFVLLYALPLLLITGLYSVIVARVWSRHVPGNATPGNVRLLNKAKRNVLKMLITVVLAFTLCWFIMHLNLLLVDFTDVFKHCGIPVELQTTGFLLGHANSAINCCIYPIFSQEFRRGFRQLLKRPLKSSRTLHSRRSQALSLEGTLEEESLPHMRSYKNIQQS